MEDAKMKFIFRTEKDNSSAFVFWQTKDGKVTTWRRPIFDPIIMVIFIGALYLGIMEASNITLALFGIVFTLTGLYGECLKRTSWSRQKQSV